MDILGAIGKLLGFGQDNKKKKPQPQQQQQAPAPQAPSILGVPSGRPQQPRQLQMPNLTPSVNTTLIQASHPNVKPPQTSPINSLLGSNPTPIPQAPPPQQPRPSDPVKGIVDAVNNNLIKPVAQDASKIYNTIAAPITGITGATMVGVDDLFNHGRNANNIAAATKAAVDENVKNSFVAPSVASGKATPVQFTGDFAKTGTHLAPYAIPGGGALTGKLGAKVAENVGGKVLNSVVNKGTQAVANAAVSAPAFAAIDAAQQGLDSNFHSFDPNQSVKAGLQAGAMTLGGNIASDLLHGGVRTGVDRANEIAAQPGYNPQAGFAKVPGSGLATAIQKIRESNPRVPNEPNLSAPSPQTAEAPQIDPKAYLKQQVKQQNAARGAGNSGFVSNIRNELSTKLIDSLSPIENTLKKANKDGANINIGDENHITPQLDRVLRADTIAGQYVKDNGLADVIQKVPNTKALDQYLIAKHAADLEANGVKTGRNLEADRQLVASLAPTYEPHAQAVMKYNQGLLDKTAEYGLISKETAKQLKKQYPNYVPANRIFGDEELNTFKGNSGGKASISGQTVVQKIKGSDRQIESPLASIAAKTQDVIKQGERNKAASILASYKDLPGNPFNLRELGPSETVGTKSTISYIDNGKVRKFETTPEIAAAAKSLNKEQMGIIGKIVAVPTRVLRLGATGVNSGFALANLAKDMASAAINSKHPLRSSVLNPKALGKATAASLYHRGKSYGELVREGAGGTSFDIARNAPKQTVARIRAEKNVRSKALYNVTHPGELLRAVEDTIGRSEEFTRALQYYGNKGAALSKNMGEADAKRYAAHAARNNTVNFARAGEYGAVLNTALPYLNAGIQGARTFVRNTKERPIRTVAKVAVLSTLPTVTTTLWNISDPERKAAYDDISDYEKEGNLIIVPEHPVKDPKTGRWNVIKIPVSQEVASLNNIARNGVEAENGDKAFDAKAALGALIGTTTSINAQSGREFMNQVTPQIFKPGIEALTNQNLFTGNKVVPDSQQNLPASEQYGNYTSGTAKTIGKLTNQSPRQIDNFLKTVLGGAGQTAVNISDSALADLGVTSPDEIQGKSFGSSISDRFAGAASKPASDYVDKAYEDAKKQLIASPDFASLSQDDKSKALNRLQTDVNAVEYNKQDTKNPNSNYTPKKLTTNQKALASGKKSATDYTKTTDSSSDETYADKYQTAKDTFDSDSKDWSVVQKAKKQKELNKLAVQKDYTNDTVDLYNMSKQDVYNLVSSDPDGKKKVDDILAYGDALVAAGLEKTNKFKDKYGNVKLDDGSEKSGSGGSKKGGSKKGRKSTFKAPKGGFNRVGSTAAIRKLLQSSGKKIKEKA